MSSWRVLLRLWQQIIFKTNTIILAGWTTILKFFSEIILDLSNVWILIVDVTWCKLAYWEERTRVGSQVSVSSSSVQVCSNTKSSNSSNSQALCLEPLFSLPEASKPSQATVRTRDKIGHGKLLKDLYKFIIFWQHQTLFFQYSNSQLTIDFLQVWSWVKRMEECGFIIAAMFLSLSILRLWMFLTQELSPSSRSLPPSPWRYSTGTCLVSTPLSVILPPMTVPLIPIPSDWAWPRAGEPTMLVSTWSAVLAGWRSCCCRPDDDIAKWDSMNWNVIKTSSTCHLLLSSRMASNQNFYCDIVTHQRRMEKKKIYQETKLWPLK